MSIRDEVGLQEPVYLKEVLDSSQRIANTEKPVDYDKLEVIFQSHYMMLWAWKMY